MTQYAGVYRGVIVNTADPDGRGRVQVRLSSLSLSTQWAEVCSAIGALRVNAPQINDTVIIAFENGSIDHPIVLGSVG